MQFTFSDSNVLADEIRKFIFAPNVTIAYAKGPHPISIVGRKLEEEYKKEGAVVIEAAVCEAISLVSKSPDSDSEVRQLFSLGLKFPSTDLALWCCDLIGRAQAGEKRSLGVVKKNADLVHEIIFSQFSNSKTRLAFFNLKLDGSYFHFHKILELASVYSPEYIWAILGAMNRAFGESLPEYFLKYLDNNLSAMLLASIINSQKTCKLILYILSAYVKNSDRFHVSGSGIGDLENQKSSQEISLVDTIQKDDFGDDIIQSLRSRDVLEEAYQEYEELVNDHPKAAINVLRVPSLDAKELLN